MATGKKSKCVLRPGIGLCDECSKPNWPQEYVGYGAMVCLDCLDKDKKPELLQKGTKKKEARSAMGKRVKPNLTDEEKKVLFHLCQAWNVFKRLEMAHPDDHREFSFGIHNLQNILAFRVARRVDPEFWA